MTSVLSFIMFYVIYYGSVLMDRLPIVAQRFAFNGILQSISLAWALWRQRTDLYFKGTIDNQGNGSYLRARCRETVQSGPAVMGSFGGKLLRANMYCGILVGPCVVSPQKQRVSTLEFVFCVLRRPLKVAEFLSGPRMYLSACCVYLT